MWNIWQGPQRLTELVFYLTHIFVTLMEPILNGKPTWSNFTALTFFFYNKILAHKKCLRLNPGIETSVNYNLVK